VHGSQATVPRGSVHRHRTGDADRSRRSRRADRLPEPVSDLIGFGCRVFPGGALRDECPRVASVNAATGEGLVVARISDLERVTLAVVVRVTNG